MHRIPIPFWRLAACPREKPYSWLLLRAVRQTSLMEGPLRWGKWWGRGTELSWSTTGTREQVEGSC